MQVGDRLTLSVKPERLADGAPGWLSWWASARGLEVRGHEFASTPASFGDLYEEAPDTVSHLNDKGAIASEVLQLVDGDRSVSEIAVELRKSRNDLSEADAKRLVVNLLRGKTQSPALSDISRLTHHGETSHGKNVT